MRTEFFLKSGHGNPIRPRTFLCGATLRAHESYRSGPSSSERKGGVKAAEVRPFLNFGKLEIVVVVLRHFSDNWRIGTMVEDFSYDIACTQETFDLLKTDERFLGLLTLARIVNALYFCLRAALDSKNVSGPVGARSRINSPLFAASVLYEGFLTVERLAVHFKTLDSYKNGFSVLLKDKAVQVLRRSVLHKMRNKFVFHFDADVAKKALGRFQLPLYKFATGIGETSGGMYYALADEAVMHYLLQQAEDKPDDSLKARYEQFLQDTIQLIGRFTDAAERLMAEVLNDMGFTVMQRPLETIDRESGPK